MSSPSELSWHDGFLLGYPLMDATYHEFVEAVTGVLNAEDAAMSEAYTILERHLESHFGQEDTWMRETDFPAGQCHIDEHTAVMKSVREVKELVNAGNTAVARDLAAELAKWFPGHADYMDSALSHWMAKRQFGGAPVVLKRGMKFD